MVIPATALGITAGSTRHCFVHPVIPKLRAVSCDSRGIEHDTVDDVEEDREDRAKRNDEDLHLSRPDRR